MEADRLFYMGALNSSPLSTVRCVVIEYVRRILDARVYDVAQRTPLDPMVRLSQRLNAEISSIQERDKQMEMESKRIDTQHQAIQTEIDSVSKVISKNIESSFKLMG